jgi:hypothetical protein
MNPTATSAMTSDASNGIVTAASALAHQDSEKENKTLTLERIENRSLAMLSRVGLTQEIRRAAA